MCSKLQDTAFVFRVKPRDFSPTVECAACYIEFDGKILFLKRADGKPEGGKWGVPGGKIEQGESSREAVIRETFEETRIALNEQQIKFVGKLFVRKPEVDYVYHMYHLKSTHFPEVKLNHEHREYRWLSMEEAVNFSVMSGGLKTLYHFKALVNQPELTKKPFYFIRHGETDVNAYPEIVRVDYDLPLNNRGRNQAQNARKVIAEMAFKSVCFSPIQRAAETKDILVPTLGIDQAEIEELSECNFHIWKKIIRLEEGEGFHVCDEVENFLGRAIRGLDKALQKKSPTLVVAHGGIHWALCYHLSIENHPWEIGNCELVHFRPVEDAGWEAEIIVANQAAR
ncbi:MAG: histidine phosphatase family protein [Waddliaceae bacterium]